LAATANRNRRLNKKVEDESGPQLIGYARVSTEDQDLRMQIDALKAAGCLHIYSEKKSGAKIKRPELDLAIKDLREGDTLVVWRLDRLARTVRQLYERLAQIEEMGAGFRSLQDRIDFSTANGKLMLAVLAAVAEFERNVTIERTKAGIAALQARGHTFGAKVKFDHKRQRKAEKLLAMRERRIVRGKSVWRDRYSLKDVAEMMDVSVNTLRLHGVTRD